MGKSHRTLMSFALILTIVIGGCSADYHANKVQKGMDANKITVGTVQQEIKIGMSSAAVIEAIGSPNVITTDENRREVWVYDKFATDVASSKGSWTILLAGQSAGAASASQRTLTVVIKYDEEKKVRDFAYHTSRF